MPICLGYLSVAFAFGIYAVQSGLSWAEALLISMTNVTSAGQLAGVPILVGGGSWMEMVLTQLVINSRYALMSISFSQKLEPDVTPLHRAAIAFVNTDEVFAVVASQPEKLGRAYLYGLILPPYLGWACGTLLGAAAGNVLPALLTAALGMAIYGMFIAIFVPAARVERPVLCCVLLAVALSCAFHFIPVLSGVPSGFTTVICTVVAAAVMAWLAPIEEYDAGAEEVRDHA